jgi:transposase-like protein
MSGYPPHLRPRLLEIAVMERGRDAAVSQLAEQEDCNPRTIHRWLSALHHEASVFMAKREAAEREAAAAAAAPSEELDDKEEVSVRADSAELSEFDRYKTYRRSEQLEAELERAMRSGNEEHARQLFDELSKLDPLRAISLSSRRHR